MTTLVPPSAPPVAYRGRRGFDAQPSQFLLARRLDYTNYLEHPRPDSPPHGYCESIVAEIDRILGARQRGAGVAA